MAGEIVLRPGGKPYLARKAPVAEVLGDEWDDTSVIVWRTHDMDVAVALADRAWLQHVGDEPLPGTGEPGWWKSAPWDAAGGGYDSTVIGVASTDRGAVPAVMFR